MSRVVRKELNKSRYAAGQSRACLFDGPQIQRFLVRRPLGRPLRAAAGRRPGEGRGEKSVRALFAGGVLLTSSAKARAFFVSEPLKIRYGSEERSRGIETFQQQGAVIGFLLFVVSRVREGDGNDANCRFGSNPFNFFDSALPLSIVFCELIMFLLVLARRKTQARNADRES